MLKDCVWYQIICTEGDSDDLRSSSSAWWLAKVENEAVEAVRDESYPPEEGERSDLRNSWSDLPSLKCGQNSGDRRLQLNILSQSP